MKKWVRGHLLEHPEDYWLRLPDTAHGIKPFDGVLICEGKPIAVEFKVWRQKKAFDFSSVRPHQMRELLLWQKAKGEAWIVVYCERDGETRVYGPTQEILDELLRKRKTRNGEHGLSP